MPSIKLCFVDLFPLLFAADGQVPSSEGGGREDYVHFPQRTGREMQISCES